MYYLSDQIENNKMVWDMAHIRDRRNAYRILVRRPEGKRPLGRPRLK